VNVVPWPSTLATSVAPPCATTMSPRPVPPRGRPAVAAMLARRTDAREPDTPTAPSGVAPGEFTRPAAARSPGRRA
jgi:hypothetical protein